jgi:hypothetical protein
MHRAALDRTFGRSDHLTQPFFTQGIWFYEAQHGEIDRSIRLVIAAIIAGLYFTGQVTGTVAIVLAVVVIVFLITSVVGLVPRLLAFRNIDAQRKITRVSGH